MAKWYLLRTTKVKLGSGVTVLSAGELVDDSTQPLLPIQNSGGYFAPSTNAVVATAAAFAQKRKKGGASYEELDSIMLAAAAQQSLATTDRPAPSTAAAGATVVAAAAIVPNQVITPRFSGKVRLRGWASFEALGAGVVTPVVKQGAATIVALAPSSGTGGPLNYNFEVEVDALPLNAAVTFSWVTTAGDATVTLGAGVTGIAAGMTVEEIP